MSAFTYPARFSTGSDGRVLVEFVDLPRVATDGRNLPEAMEEAVDAFGSDLSLRLSRREEIPAPSPAKRGQRLIPGWWIRILVQQYVWHTHICSDLKVSGPGSIVPPKATRC